MPADQPSAPPTAQRRRAGGRVARVAALAGALAGAVALFLVAVSVGVVTVNRDHDSARSTKASARAAAGLLTVTAVPTNFGDTCNDQQGWAFPQSISTLPVVKHVNDADWVARYGGVPVSGNNYAFSLSAPTDVVITGIRASVVSQAPPLQGVYPAPWTSGCSGVVPGTFRLNLDDSPVTVAAMPGDELGGPGGADVLPHTLSHDEPEVWHLTPVTQDCLCGWVATVDWTVGDQAFSTQMDDNGQPFQVTATSDATMIDNDDGQLDYWQVTTLGG